MTHALASEVVHRFIASIGRPQAAEQYLELFHAEQKHRFACLIIAGDVIKDSHNALVTSLIFLQRLELTPVLMVESAALQSDLLHRLPSDVPIRSATAETAADVANSGSLPILVAPRARDRTLITATLAPRKVIYLINQSGLQPEGEPVRSLINMRTDLAALVGPRVLPTAQQRLLRDVDALFEAASHAFTVSITSAQDLLRELFTVRGAGTLLRRGTEVARLRDYGQLDRMSFAALLRSAFGHPPAEGIYARELVGLYLASNYQGVAVLESGPLAPYLSKFAVDLRAQGEGVGGDLWRAMCDDHPRFFWRSRPGNPIASWYAARCDGLLRCADWTVYWRGLPASDIPQVIALAQAAPIDFAVRS